MAATVTAPLGQRSRLRPPACQGRAASHLARSGSPQWTPARAAVRDGPRHAPPGMGASVAPSQGDRQRQRERRDVVVSRSPTFVPRSAAVTRVPDQRRDYRHQPLNPASLDAPGTSVVGVCAWRRGVEAALIAGSASITVGLIAAYASTRQGDRSRKLQRKIADEQRRLQERPAERSRSLTRGSPSLGPSPKRQARAEEKALDAQQALELFRVPLQDAADDLGHRINNIRSDEFLVYVEKENRRQEIAVLGTA
jgi:hypothetical protein